MRKSLAKLAFAFAGILLIGGFASCSLNGPLQPLILQAQIGSAEQRWQAQHIASYRIQVQQMSSIWHLQRHTITVRDGVVVDQSATCIPAPIEGRECKVRPFVAEDYTVAGLFETARSIAKSTAGGMTITFDPTYGFPSTIGSAPPGVIDGDQSWVVLSFEVLNS